MSQRKRRETGGAAAKSRALSENEVALVDVLKWLLAEVKNDAIARRQECRWTSPVLIAAAILWVWLDEPTLTGRYARSLKIARRLFRAVPEISYQAFIKLLSFARPRVRHLNVATFRQNVGFFERSARTLARCGYVSLQAA